ncbi:MAG: leucyl aminopeptidase [Gaiellales bacterium]
MSVYTHSFVELCKKELELCAVHEGEIVAVLSQGDQRQDYARSFLDAAQLLGATAFHVNIPNPSSSLDGEFGAWTVGQTPLANNRPAIDALKQADMVIDTMFLLFSPEQLEIQAAGTRILLCIEPVELLTRMFPTKELRERIEICESMLAGAKTLRFTNPAGSDVSYELGALPVLTQYGYTDTPGRWDHWPSTFAFTGGADDGVNGKVVIAPGDVLLPHKTYVQSPIELTIAKGRITDISGGVDAALLSDYMESFDDENAYGIAHIGWGMDPRARWSCLTTDTRGMGMEIRSFYGNVLFSTGPNSELGGTNHTACHVDVPMHGCSLFLDDEPVVIDGDIVVPALKDPSRS